MYCEKILKITLNQEEIFEMLRAFNASDPDALVEHLVRTTEDQTMFDYSYNFKIMDDGTIWIEGEDNN